MTWPDFWKIDHDKRWVTLTKGSNSEERSDMLRQTIKAGVESSRVLETKKWANELFPVYSVDGEHVLSMDGAGTDAFGVITFAAHMIGYVHTEEGDKYWVPRRSPTKMSCPNMLDNTVGDCLSAGEKPIDCIVRECEEEISLDPEYTSANLKACGMVVYIIARTDYHQPGCQHQVQYLYEMEFGKDIVPKIGDGEVAELNLMTLDQGRSALTHREFEVMLCYNLDIIFHQTWSHHDGERGALAGDGFSPATITSRRRVSAICRGWILRCSRGISCSSCSGKRRRGNGSLLWERTCCPRNLPLPMGPDILNVRR